MTRWLRAESVEDYKAPSWWPEERKADLEAAVKADTPPPKWHRLEFAMIVSRAWKDWYRVRGRNPDARRSKIPATTRQLVFQRDEGICQLCGDPVEGEFHIDHVKPVALGGTDVAGNLQVAHPVCNLRKGARA